jgi:hypothetical protein
VFLHFNHIDLYRHICNSSDEQCLQQDLNRFKAWSDTWLLRLNVAKCSTISYHGEGNCTYYIGDDLLDKVESTKDLGVLFDKNLRFSQHIQAKVAHAYGILCLIQRNFRYLDSRSFICLYKSLVRSHLEYCNAVWAPHRLGDIKLIEKVQMRATKSISSLKHLPYTERLKVLGLPTLHYRRVRGDMILVYLILHGYYDSAAVCQLKLSDVCWTRGNTYKLHPTLVKDKFARNFFVNRVIKIWNSLPDTVVGAPSVNIFKNLLDKHWANQDLLYNWHSVIAGTGSRSAI